MILRSSCRRRALSWLTLVRTSARAMERRVNHFKWSGIMELLERTAERPHAGIENVIVNGQHQRDSLLMEKESIICASVNDPSPMPAHNSWQQEWKKRKPGRIMTDSPQDDPRTSCGDRGAVASGHGTDDAVNQRYWNLFHKAQPSTVLVQQGGTPAVHGICLAVHPSCNP